MDNVLDLILRVDTGQGESEISKLQANLRLLVTGFQTGQLSLEKFNTEVAKLVTQAKAIGVESVKVVNFLDRTNRASFNAANGFRGMATEMKNVNTAALNFGRFLQDLPYGILGVANNIEPMVTSFRTLKNEVGGVKAAMSNLIGVGGPMIAISAFAAALQWLPILFRDTKDQVIELKAQLAGIQDLPFVQKALEYKAERAKVDPSWFQKNILSLFTPLAAYGDISPEAAQKMQIAVARMFKWEQGVKIPGIPMPEVTVTGKMPGTAGEEFQYPYRWSALGLPMQEPRTEREKEFLSGVQRLGKYVTPGQRVAMGVEGPKIGELMPSFTGGELFQIDALMTGADAFVSTIRDGLTDAWQKAFGEANSMLEMFLQRFAIGLLETLAQRAVGGALDFLLPGVGGLLGGIFGGVGGSVSAGGQTQMFQKKYDPSPVVKAIERTSAQFTFVQRGQDLVAVYDRNKPIVARRQI